MTRFLSLVALIAGLLAVAAGPVSADHCDAYTGIEGNTGSAGFNCDHRVDDDDEDGGDPAPAGHPERDLWNARCSQYGAYQEGITSASVTRGDAIEGGETGWNYEIGFGGYAYSPTGDSVTVPSGETWYNWSIACRTPTGVEVQNEIGPAAGPVPINPLDLRAAALARISIEDPRMAASPPLDDPDRHSVVQIPTWFWLEDPWTPITETEAAGGFVVEVIANPVHVRWETGDGETVTCEDDDAVEAWAPGRSDDETVCKHTYTEPSVGVGAGDAYEVTATALWEFSWTLNGADQGVFAAYEAESTVSHQVGEIQAVGKASP